MAYSSASDPHGEQLPGMTRLGPEPAASIRPYADIKKMAPLMNRKAVLLATANVTDDNLFSNGLFQNVILLYRMFEAMAWTPILIVNERPKNMEKVPKQLALCRVVTAEELLKQPIPVYAYIEIGMSIDPMVRKFLKMIGAKICKLYLGNIINIDIETPIFYPEMNFSHHVIGELDKIWVSPHYAQHDQYACSLNHCAMGAPESQVGPYVWDPSFVLDDGKRHVEWRPTMEGEKESIVITEPNISFQKSSIVPLLMIERWYRKLRASGKTWNGQVVVVNGPRIMQIPYFKQNIYDNLDLVKDGKIEMANRKDIITTLKTYPNATFVCHQFNNEFNYMVMELMWLGFPVLHNAKSWESYGYYYPGSDLDAGGDLLSMVSGHVGRLEVYKAHARALAWRHSPYNTDVQKAWEKLLA
jgi:hypothetical protein